MFYIFLKLFIYIIATYLNIINILDALIIYFLINVTQVERCIILKNTHILKKINDNCLWVYKKYIFIYINNILKLNSYHYLILIL